MKYHEDFASVNQDDCRINMPQYQCPRCNFELISIDVQNKYVIKTHDENTYKYDKKKCAKCLTEWYDIDLPKCEECRKYHVDVPPDLAPSENIDGAIHITSLDQCTCLQTRNQLPYKLETGWKMYAGTPHYFIPPKSVKLRHDRNDTDADRRRKDTDADMTETWCCKGCTIS